MLSTVYTVSDLTRRITQTIQDEIGSVTVEGEISNFKTYTSGHSYFVLKDAGAQLNAVLFAGTRSRLHASLPPLKDGLKVRAGGEITVYPQRGQYQLIVRSIQVAGAGDLMAKFEELKERLTKEGLFAPERKRPLPVFPRCIGIVTSPTGAVIHDMMTVLGRRFPNLHILLAPVKVQGEGAAAEIAAAITFFNQLPKLLPPGSPIPIPDVLIVGRGGGSLEDLWAFNEEVVVRAVAASDLPVISAVGHETDFTLCDFAADKRAPTPSAAAEIVIEPKATFEARIAEAGAKLIRAVQQAQQQASQTVDTLDMRLQRVLQQRAQSFRPRLEKATSRLGVLRERAVRNFASRVAMDRQRMEQTLRVHLQQDRTCVQNLAGNLKMLSPFAVLDRGYTLTRLADGTLLRAAAGVPAGAELETRFKDGTVRSKTIAPAS